MTQNREKRKELTTDSTVAEILATMSEGNPGAINVLVGIVKSSEDGIFSVLSLDDMNIRGTQIWVGFKDYCKQDLNAFVKALNDRDEKMVEAINRVGREGNHPHKAVKSGASFGKREFL